MPSARAKTEQRQARVRFQLQGEGVPLLRATIDAPLQDYTIR